MVSLEKGYIYGVFKRGDMRISDKKHKNTKYYDGMLVDYIDTIKSNIEYTIVTEYKISGEIKSRIITTEQMESGILPPENSDGPDKKVTVYNGNILSDNMAAVYCIVKFSANDADFIKQSSESVGGVIINDDVVADDSYRKSKVVLDWEYIENNLPFTGLFDKAHSKEKLPIIDSTSISPENFLIDSTTLDLKNREEILDVMVIVSGGYTVGIGGDYSNWNAAFSDVGNLSGDLTLTQISDITGNNFTSLDSELNGYTLTITSNFKHYGSPKFGYYTYHNRDGNYMAVRVEGPGNFVMEDLYFKYTITPTASSRMLYVIGVDTTFNGYFKNLLFDGNGRTSNGSTFRIVDNTPIIKCWNFKVWDGAGIEFDDCNNSNIVENLTVYGTSDGVDLNNQNITVNNCLVFGTTNNDWNNIGSSTGSNNASEDSTSDDSNWSTGSANITGITQSDEVLSTSDVEIGFLRVVSGGSCYNGGKTPEITDNDSGIRKNERNGVSIGADEYSDFETLCFSVGTSTDNFMVGSPTIEIISGELTFSVPQTGDIGVGDQITYTNTVTSAGTDTLQSTKTCQIVGKISETVWSVLTESCGYLTEPSGTDVVSIKRTFNDLNSALDGTNSGIYQILNNSNIISGCGFNINVACYDDGNDNTYTTIEGWTTDDNGYITVYTPTNTADECNNDQRHDCTVSGSGYTLEFDASTTSPGITDYPIEIKTDYTVIEGLKVVANSYHNTFVACIDNDVNANYVRIEKNLICIEYDSVYNGHGIYVRGLGSGSGNFTGFTTVKNNIVISQSGAGSNIARQGIHFASSYLEDIYYGDADPGQDFCCQNNTVYGPFRTDSESRGAIVIGFVGNSADRVHYNIKNNYAYNTEGSRSFSFDNDAGGIDLDETDPEFDYNASHDSTAGSTNNNQQILLSACKFINTSYASADLHIQSDSGLINQGIGPGSDPCVPTDDIDGDTREGTTTDIGADLYYTQQVDLGLNYSWNVSMP